ncbi:MAG TPA: type II secretion system secretin GspD [Kofleriaceae bacterium]|jgi:general secretion pathway protein D
MRLVLAFLLITRVAFADDNPELYHCERKPTTVAVSFKPETDLKELVSWAMGFTCKNFMFDPSYVQRGKKINIVTPETMTPDQAYELFLAALSTMGYTVVAQGNMMRIVESATARNETLPMFDGHSGEQLVRYLLRPSHATAPMLATALSAMKSQAGDIAVLGSMLLVTDTATHVRDMLDVVKQIDQAGSESGVYTVPVLHADATALAKEIDLLSATTPGAGSASSPQAAAPKIVVDTRTNTLIVAGNEAAYDRVRAIIARVDIPIETETGGQMHIYRLKAAVAEEVAAVLQAAISGKASATPAQSNGAKPGATPAAASLDSLALEGQAHVIPDKATNKLIVMSTGHDFVALKHVIDELDEPRREVYIEAVIIDVNDDDTSALGTSSHGTLPIPGATSSSGPSGIVLGGVQSGGLSSMNPSTAASATGLIGGILGNALTAAGATQLLGTSFPSYGVLFQALSQINHTAVISAPSIIALDNEDAKYSVGKTIPIKKGTVPVSPTNPTGLVTTNIEDQDLTLDFDIKPHISEGDDVLLEVKHSQKDEAGAPDPILGPSWTTRTIETRLVAHDQQTVMLTGLTQIKELDLKTKVPILGDIPVIGTLFSYTSKEKVKSNLVILLTPYIIRSRLDIDQIRERHQREQDEFIGSLRALDSAAFHTNVDYGKKRGLVEEINRSVGSVQDEAAARAQLSQPSPVQIGPVH